MSCRQGTYMRDVESHANYLFPYFFSSFATILLLFRNFKDLPQDYP